MDRKLAEELIKKVLPSYEIGELLGEGSFGAVFKMKDSLKERAVKIITLTATRSIENGSVKSASTKIERDFRHIVDSYERIACEEIVTVYDFYKVFADDVKQDKAYAIVVMEIYPSNLHDYVIDQYEKSGSHLNVEKAKSLMERLANLLGNLYTKRQFLFEDMKPENLLVKDIAGDFKLVVGDIGGLKNIGGASATGSQVTLSYCAPEVIRKGQKPDLRSIMYSYGLLCYFMLEGHLPYENSEVLERMDLIKNKGLVFSRGDIPANLKSVIAKCLAFESEQRYKDFSEITKAIQGEWKTTDETVDLSSFRRGASDETMDLGSFMKGAPHVSTPAEEGKDLGKRTVAAADRTMFTAPKSLTEETRRRAETTRISAEKNVVEKIDKEIRGLVIKSGDFYKLKDENYKIYGDIKVERGAVLTIENAGLYFDNNSGIVSLGTLRAKNTVFNAIDFSKGWKNIVINPADMSINFIEGCKFSFGRGRAWKELKYICRTSVAAFNDQGLYGGALFITEVKDKKLTVKDCTFYKCSALEGGGIYSLKAEPVIEKCKLESCSAGLTGGGINCMNSAALIKSCTLNKCSADKGGAGIYCASSNPAIEDCVFDICVTKYLYGGGIYCSASSPTIKNCKFNHCSATKDGGGMYCDDKSQPKITHLFYSNCRPNNTNYDPNAVNARNGFLGQIFK